MEFVFADAGYWIAMMNDRDVLHTKATFLTSRPGSRTILTSEMVLVEFLNFVSRYGPDGRRQAANTVERLRADRTIEIVPQTGAQFSAAAALYSQRPDQRWSVTDCASILIMRERGIWEVLTHDRDFVQAGFRALLRDD